MARLEDATPAGRANRVLYPWEGPDTYVRRAVTRGSAAGAAYAGVDLHRLAGLDYKGADVAACGMTFGPQTVRSTKNPDGLKLCPRCYPGSAIGAQDQFEAEFEAKLQGATEVRLSKADGASYSKPKMAAFLAVLDRWARRMADDGYEIRSEPEAGPGTMVWKAVKR